MKGETFFAGGSHGMSKEAGEENDKEGWDGDEKG